MDVQCDCFRTELSNLISHRSRGLCDSGCPTKRQNESWSLRNLERYVSLVKKSGSTLTTMSYIENQLSGFWGQRKGQSGSFKKLENSRTFFKSYLKEAARR